MKTDWKRYISSEPKVMLGKPVIKGTRITVESIIEKLAEAESFEQIIESHPHISKKAILACLSFASDSIKNEISYSLV
jgi:uncharacterized protein (DUF433 family)